MPRTAALSKVERAKNARLEKERLEREYAALCAERERKRKEDDERAAKEFRERRDAASRLEKELADAARRTEKATERKHAKRREAVIGALLERYRHDPAYGDLYVDVVQRFDGHITKHADRSIFGLAPLTIANTRRSRTTENLDPDVAASESESNVDTELETSAA